MRALFDRAIKRAREPFRSSNRVKSRHWCEVNAVNTHDFILGLNAELAHEAIKYNDDLLVHAEGIYNTIPFTMGGGADSTLLYFFTRYFEPEIVVETGVSMGFSSHAFLSAFLENKRGKLYSSDLPYFMEENPEEYVGCMVPNELKAGWNLYLKGDKDNLKSITNTIDRIDIFHYDSDKSYSGRTSSFKLVSPLLNDEALIIFDDIDINLHFRHLSERTDRKTVVLKKPNGDYVGLIFPKSHRLKPVPQ